MRILTLCVFLSAQGLQAQSPPEEQTAAVTNAQDKATESDADIDWGKLMQISAPLGASPVGLSGPHGRIGQTDWVRRRGC